MIAEVSEWLSQGLSERFGLSMARTVPSPDPGSEEGVGGLEISK